MEIFVISNNLENRSYMISCNPVKALDIVFSFIYGYYILQIPFKKHKIRQ